MTLLDVERLAPAVTAAVTNRFGADVTLAAIYLFGSFAQGTARSDSDVDIGVLPSRPLERAALYDAAQDVAVAIGRDVHLLDLLSLPTVMAAIVVTTGSRISVADRRAADEFCARTLAEYAYLNEVRRPAMEAFLAPYLEMGTGGSHRG